MDMLLRKSHDSDFPFLRKMLYETVFWRAIADGPSLFAIQFDQRFGCFVADVSIGFGYQRK